jgi:rod shape-determining protein MreC
VALSRRSGRSRFTLVLLILTSVTVLTLDFRNAGVVEGARDIAATVFSPVRGAAETVFRPVGNAWHGVTDYPDVRAENEALRKRIAELEGDQVLNADATKQLQELLDQVEIPWVGDISTATARVVSGPSTNFAHTIDIDKGSDAGVKVGMPVVSGDGLVGRVVQASSARATVELLTDPEFRVGVRLVQTRQLGTARGRGRGGTLAVDSNIDPDTTVKRGAFLTTSGTDRSAFPADIPVGEVASTRDTGGPALELLVKPFVDLDRLTFVNVMLWEPAQ